MKSHILFIFLMLTVTSCTEVVPVYIDTQSNVIPDVSGVDTNSGLPTADIPTQPDTAQTTDTPGSIPDTAGTDSAQVTPDIGPPSDTSVADTQGPLDTSSPDTSVESSSYWLGTSEITDKSGTTGTLIVSHNALALFPLDLSESIKNIEQVSNNTLLKIQTLGFCGGNQAELDAQQGKVEEAENGDLKLLGGHQLMTNIGNVGVIPTKNIATILKVEFEMPYFVPQDEFERIPTTFCYGYRKNGQWYVNLEPITATQNAVEQKADGIIATKLENVSAIFLLFDSTAAINWIRYEAALP